MCLESRQQQKQEKRPSWKGDDTLCVEGRSCEFFLMCWMSAGLMESSCGGIMYACCHRKDPKSNTEYNLVEVPRDQSQTISLDDYMELHTTFNDRKSPWLKSKMLHLSLYCTFYHFTQRQAHTMYKNNHSKSISNYMYLYIHRCKSCQIQGKFNMITGCGIPVSKQTAQRRIVGGDEAGFGSFPWQVCSFRSL